MPSNKGRSRSARMILSPLAFTVCKRGHWFKTLKSCPYVNLLFTTRKYVRFFNELKAKIASRESLLSPTSRMLKCNHREKSNGRALKELSLRANSSSSVNCVKCCNDL